jgi:hypothetical protein
VVVSLGAVLAIATTGCASVFTNGSLVARGGRALGCVEASAAHGRDAHDYDAFGRAGQRFVLVDVAVGNGCRDPVTLHFDRVTASIDGRHLELVPMEIAPVRIDVGTMGSEILAFRDPDPVRDGAQVCVALDHLTEPSISVEPACFTRPREFDR